MTFHVVFRDAALQFDALSPISTDIEARLLQSLGGSISTCKNLVVSLSGGVDSMVHLCLLKRLGLVEEGRICALHVRHSNRDDALQEQRWVEYVCCKLGVPLYVYHIRLVRPHNGLQTGVSREEYEEFCKEIRYHMYRQAGKLQWGQDEVTVLIGHHLDDVDENRLAELGKGTLVNINGMQSILDGSGGGVMRSTTTIRPLCNCTRKHELLELAKEFKLPYMADSTPEWSRRGWIRKILDDYEGREELIKLLYEAGSISNFFYVKNLEILDLWKRSKGIRSAQDLSIDFGKQKSCVMGGIGGTLLDLGRLCECAKVAGMTEPDVQKKAGHLSCLVSQIALLWNSTVACYCDKVSIQRQKCPVQEIREARATLGGPECFPIEFLSFVLHSCSHSELLPYLKDPAIGRKAVQHLWSTALKQTKRKYVFTALNKDCPVMYLKDHHALLFISKTTVMLEAVKGHREALGAAIFKAFSGTWEKVLG